MPVVREHQELESVAVRIPVVDALANHPAARVAHAHSGSVEDELACHQQDHVVPAPSFEAPLPRTHQRFQKRQLVTGLTILSEQTFARNDREYACRQFESETPQALPGSMIIQRLFSSEESTWTPGGSYRLGGNKPRAGSIVVPHQRGHEKETETLHPSRLFVTLLMLFAQGALADTTLGTEQVVVHSKVLDEDRPINIVLPTDQLQDARYPVVVLLDGENPFAHWAIEQMHMKKPGLIIVGVENVNRTRDMFANPVRKEPNPGGGAGQFLEFLVSELLPYIDESYPSNGYHVLSGQSNSALFTLYAMCRAPDAFDAFLASSPMIGWDWDLIREETTDLFKDRDSFPKVLYMNHGESDSFKTTDFMPAYLQLLEATAPDDFRWKFEVAEGQSHVPENSHGNGIAFIFSVH
jgi:predicted alpha/beta superfamily hydrolase